jgi:transcriptional regulator with XRE-family HTH domain
MQLELTRFGNKPTNAPLQNGMNRNAELLGYGGRGAVMFDNLVKSHANILDNCLEQVKTNVSFRSDTNASVDNYLNQIKVLAELRRINPKTQGERIRLLRNMHGMSQKEFAKLAGITAKDGGTTVSQWENKRNKKISTVQALTLCSKLGIAARWIVCMTDDPTDFLSIPPTEQLFIDLFRRLSEDERKTIIDLMKSLAAAHPASKPTAENPYPHLPPRIDHESD